MTRPQRCPACHHDPGWPGMVVDGDVLRDVIADAVPRLISDDGARGIAEATLDNAVSAGMTVLHGPNGTPRVVADDGMNESFVNTDGAQTS